MKGFIGFVCSNVLLTFCFLLSGDVNSQVVFYAVTPDSRVFKAEMHPNSLCIANYFSDCSSKVRDLAIYKDTLYCVNETGELFYTILSNPSAGNCGLIGSFGGYIAALTAGEHGYVYAAGGGKLYRYSKSDGFTTIGQFPSSIEGFDGDLAFFNNTLYLTGFQNGRPVLVEVNINTPVLSTVYMNLNTTAVLGLIALSKSCTGKGLYLVGKSPVDGSSSALQEIDLINKVVLPPACSYSSMFNGAATDYATSGVTGFGVEVIKIIPACSGVNTGAIELKVTGSAGNFIYKLGTQTNSSGLFYNLPAGILPLKISNEQNCIIVDSVIEIPSSNPVFDVQIIPPLCNSSTGEIKATGDAGLMYALNNGPFAVNSIFSHLASGNYVLTARDARGCTSSKDIQLKSKIQGEYAFVLQNANCGKNNGKITFTRQGMNEPVSITLNGNTPSTTGNFDNLSGSTYHLVITDATGCQSDTTIILSTTLPPQIISVRTMHPCDNDTASGSLNFNVSGSNTFIINGTPAGTTNLFTGLTAGDHHVRITNTDGCIKDTTLRLTLQPVPALITAVQHPSCELDDGIVFFRATEPQLMYSFNNGSFDTESRYTKVQPGSYAVAVKNFNGCISTDSVRLEKPSCIDAIYFPTAFTPNNDGLNDLFKPRAYNALKEYRLVVYNRFGQNIFETNNVHNGWDGTIRGVTQQAGSYIWMSVYCFKGNVKVEYQKGTILLIR
jgi:gliding motility-associated-like protein